VRSEIESAATDEVGFIDGLEAFGADAAPVASSTTVPVNPSYRRARFGVL